MSNQSIDVFIRCGIFRRIIGEISQATQDGWSHQTEATNRHAAGGCYQDEGIAYALTAQMPRRKIMFIYSRNL